MSLFRREVNPTAVTQGVVSKEAQRVRRNVDRIFARCRKANSVAEFFACIDSAPPPARDVARTIVLQALQSMGFQYGSWEEAKRDAKNIPYYYLMRTLGMGAQA
jgi:hypothetical protein